MGGVDAPVELVAAGFRARMPPSAPVVPRGAVGRRGNGARGKGRAVRREILTAAGVAAKAI